MTTVLDVIATLSPTIISSAEITMTDVSPDALPRMMIILGWRRVAFTSRSIVDESQIVTWLTSRARVLEWFVADETVR